MCGDLFFGRESCSEFSPSSRAAEFAAHTRRYEDNKVKCIINGFAGVGVGTLSGSKGIVRTCREERESVLQSSPEVTASARGIVRRGGRIFSHTPSSPPPPPKRNARDSFAVSPRQQRAHFSFGYASVLPAVAAVAQGVVWRKAEVCTHTGREGTLSTAERTE